MPVSFHDKNNDNYQLSLTNPHSSS